MASDTSFFFYHPIVDTLNYYSAKGHVMHLHKLP